MQIAEHSRSAGSGENKNRINEDGVQVALGVITSSLLGQDLDEFRNPFDNVRNGFVWKTGLFVVPVKDSLRHELRSENIGEKNKGDLRDLGDGRFDGLYAVERSLIPG